MHPESAYLYLLDRSQRADRIGDLLRPDDIKGLNILAESIVIGLNGRGTERCDPHLKNTLLKLLPYDVKEAIGVLNSRDSAPVRVSAYVPPFVRKDDKLDMTVTAYDRNVNLDGGVLVNTPLKRYVKPVGNVDRAFSTRDGLVSAGLWAYGEGLVSLTPVYVAGEPRTRSTPRVGFVPAGAVLEKAGAPSLILRKPDPYTALLIEKMITQRFAGKAQAIYTGMITVVLPEEYDGDWKRFLDVIRHIDLRPVRGRGETDRRIEGEIRRLDDPRPVVRYGAECALEAYGPLAAPALRRVSQGGSANVRRAALRVLARLKDPEVLDPLIAESRSAGGESRLEAARLLAVATDAPRNAVVQRLIQMLADPDPFVRYTALMSLEELKVEGTGVVAYFSRQKTFVMHMAAIEGEKAVVVKTRNGIRRIDLFGTGIKIKPPVRVSVGGVELVAGPDGVRVRLKRRSDIGVVGINELDLQVLVARLDRLDVSINDIIGVIAELNKTKVLNTKVYWTE